jgi:membrane protein implicated in regulation of membrane protease activity
LTLWIFLLTLSAAAILINFGWLVAMVGIFALAMRFLLVVIAALVLGVVVYGLWRLYRNHRRERTPRLIFKGK